MIVKKIIKKNWAIKQTKMGKISRFSVIFRRYYSVKTIPGNVSESLELCVTGKNIHSRDAIQPY